MSQVNLRDRLIGWVILGTSVLLLLWSLGQVYHGLIGDTSYQPAMTATPVIVRLSLLLPLLPLTATHTPTGELTAMPINTPTLIRTAIANPSATTTTMWNPILPHAP